MVRQELKRALGSKAFFVACGITLAMLALGIYDRLWSPGAEFVLPTAWQDLYLHSTYLGMIAVFYPIVAMVPHVLSYRRDLDSGYRQLLLLKTTRAAYLWAKLLAVSGSAFLSMLLPCLCWIPICRLLGVTDPSCDGVRQVVHFALPLYDAHPGWYMAAYAFHMALLAALFALLGLGLSAVVRNRYLALLLPFCYAVFSSSVLGALLGDSVAALDLMPLQMYHYREVYPLGFWTVPVYEAVLLAAGIILFLGGDHHEGKT